VRQRLKGEETSEEGGCKDVNEFSHQTRLLAKKSDKNLQKLTKINKK